MSLSAPAPYRMRTLTSLGDKDMDARELHSIQAPLKARFRQEPEAARITLKATGRIDDDDIICKVDTAQREIKAGLHPASGGKKATVCAGEMLLEALAACAGVSLKAVATCQRYIIIIRW